MTHGGVRAATRRWACICVPALTAWIVLTGCGTGPLDGLPLVPSLTPRGAQAQSGDASSDANQVALTAVPDGPFELYTPLTLAEGSFTSLEASIGFEDEVQVFEVGPLAEGDRLYVTAEGADGLDPVVAVFDAAGDVLVVNDDRDYYGGNLDARIDVLSPRQTPRCYVAVAGSYLSRTIGSYVLRLRRWPGAVAPQVQPQLVYLNFDGADAVVIGRRSPVTIPPFEGSVIGAEFAYLTDGLIEQTVEQIRRDYTGLNVEFVSSREAPEPVEPHSTVHFGAYDSGLLGIADYVDEFNQAVRQQAIIFVDSFEAFLPLHPSVEEMANALANVASHETGHLLGLSHTADPRGVMDITANLREMLANQAFRRSPLHEEVFPVGHQDPSRLLIEAVGGDATAFKAAAADQLAQRSSWYDRGDPVPARLDRPFSCCGCASCAKARQNRMRNAETR